MNGDPRELAVDVRALTVRFGAFTAVDDVTFSVRRGEIFGFLGANGAGKTTTIRVLCGLLPPTQGEVTVAGLPLGDRPERIKAKVGYMSQRFTLYDDLTVGENLQFAGALRKVPLTLYRKRVAELLEFVGYDRPLTTFVKDLPGGTKQQISLTASLLHDPELIFLDEPTAGVTPAARARFWTLIRRLADGGKTVFVTTHYMDEAEQCGRIALMRTGRLIALDSPAGLKKQSFPGPLFALAPPPEATGLGAAGGAWAQELTQQAFVESLKPHGLRHHLALRAEPVAAARWQEYRATRLPGFACTPIEPSLEDVFIRLVEGGPT